jgi:poly(3-hydroxybutyrate) depolymerase
MRYGHIRRWLVAATAALVGLGVVGATASSSFGAGAQTAAGGTVAAAGGGVAAAGGSVAAAAATAGCGKAPTLTSGSRTIQSGGTSRSYILRIPDNYDRNHPYKLIFGFHWNGGTANDVDSGGTSGYTWSYYGQRSLANNTAIFVAPQGIGNGWANSGDRDLTFVDDMVRLFESDLCVDTTQLFSIGFSYGGGMSYSIACSRATVFRAVVVYSGGQLSGCSGGTLPIAYMGIHGLRDPVLPIATGRSLRDRFVRNNGCTAQTPREPAQGSLTHTVTYYQGCRAGYPVVWAAFDAGHTPNPWDGSTSDFNDGGKSWTKPLVWDFLNQFQSTPVTTPPTTTTSAPPTTTTSTTSPAVTTPVTTTAPSGGGACQVSVKVNPWNTGLTEDITVTNTGGSAVNGWSLAFTLPSGQTISSGWNATYEGSSGSVTARNASYNAAIAANASVSIGFQATHTGNTAAPSGFRLNGATCTVA